MRKMYFLIFVIFASAVILHMIGIFENSDESKSHVNVTAPTPTVTGASDVKTITSLPGPAPASVSTLPMRGERILVGSNVENFQDPKQNLEMLNTINPQWDKKLSTELYRFMPDGTKADFTKVRSLIKIKKGKGKYVEEVLITYKLPDGEVTRFNAEVDSQTGRITSTWNRTIVENSKAEKKNLVHANGALYFGKGIRPYYKSL